MCNGLYLGARQGEPRPDPFWTNPAIKPIASQPDADDIPGVADHLDPNFTQTIKVTVRNQAAYDIPSVLDLYWSDPTTGFIADPTRLIESQYPVVPARDTLGGIDGTFASLFSWLPSSTSAPSTNGGHVCLLARTGHNPVLVPGGGNCGGGFPDDLNPSTDFRTAIHNILLVAGGWRMKMLHFAFAATNPLPKAVGSKLSVRVLDPERDSQHLERLLTPARNYAFAAQGNRFGIPADIGVSLGHERALARPVQVIANAGKARVCSPCEAEVRTPGVQMRVPRLGFSGVIIPELEQRLRGSRKYTQSESVDLMGFEIRQAIVSVTPGEGADLFAFEVVHETTDSKPRVLGGITFIFKLPKPLF